MSVKIFVPRDSTAIALGANDVANAITSQAKAKGIQITLVRNGSRGMFWLEPLVEVEINGERHAYGPVTEEDVKSLF
jgi:formate dehydrogenase iron-sulfur subunit